MKKLWNFTVAMTLVLTMFIGQFSAVASAENTTLTAEQSNAIAMLNYITVLTQEVNASKNSRLYMENAYASLINNTYPNAVDNRTLSQLTGLLDTMENYRMVAVKRERLQFIYEQNQAQAIRAAVPNPLGLMSGVHSFTPGRLAASIAYMAVDSVTSYTAYTEETDLQYIKDGWALDDEEATALHNSRKGTFSYMVKMVGDYNLPGDLTLNENAVDEFVQWKNNENIVSRIQFFESNQATYQSYGGYWLALAECYYRHGDYEKCLKAMDAYEGLGTRIFRRDHEYARLLPLAVAAADEVLDDASYADLAARYAQAIIDNTNHEEWALRYFAAQTYVDLYGKTNQSFYLEKAYDITLDTVNYLVPEQRTLNAAYIAPVQEAEKPKDATKEERTQIDNYNKMLREERKTAMIPIYEPLKLNCDLLFALADQLQISESEQLKVDEILHMRGEPIFLSQALDQQYWFIPAASNVENAEIDLEFGGTEMVLPVEALTNGAVITVKVSKPNGDDDASVILNDWVIDHMDRVAEDDINSFRVVYTSAEAKRHTWIPDAKISIDIHPLKDNEEIQYHFEYKTTGTKQEWYDYFKVWEGHKNNWYDYFKVWENSVIFERVK